MAPGGGLSCRCAAGAGRGRYRRGGYGTAGPRRAAAADKVSFAEPRRRSVVGERPRHSRRISQVRAIRSVACCSPRSGQSRGRSRDYLVLPRGGARGTPGGSGGTGPAPELAAGAAAGSPTPETRASPGSLRASRAAVNTGEGRPSMTPLLPQNGLFGPFPQVRTTPSRVASHPRDTGTPAYRSSPVPSPAWSSGSTEEKGVEVSLCPCSEAPPQQGRCSQRHATPPPMTRLPASTALTCANSGTGAWAQVGNEVLRLALGAVMNALTVSGSTVPSDRADCTRGMR
ncbi:MAG: hypothetical protein JWO98_1983 [Frankiales bacterium]|nr:hypothetical protein [Frankiales bacterium]